MDGRRVGPTEEHVGSSAGTWKHGRHQVQQESDMVKETLPETMSNVLES